MKCPLCTGILDLKEIKELEDHAEVVRVCRSCGHTWELHHKGGNLEAVVQEGVTLGEIGFSYTCPKCGHSSHVYTVLRPAKGSTWKCIQCGEPIPVENLTYTGDYAPIVEVRMPRTPTSRRRSAPAYQRRTPREPRALPDGAISASQLAEEIGMEPRKLRAWLRKSNWRSSDESRSRWAFSPAEAQEIKSHFGK